MFVFFKRICRLAVLGTALISYDTASAGIIEIPAVETLFKTDAAITSSGDSVTFDIDRQANVMIKLKGVAEVSFEYTSQGYFRLNYLTSPSSKYMVEPYFLIGRSVSKGKGHLTLNLRHTINWAYDTYPLLIFMGTGKFTIKNLKVESVANLSSYSTEKNSAFFWRPETLRPSLVGFITPIYWNFSKKITLPEALGVAYVIAIAIVLLAAFFRNKSLTKLMPRISVVFMIIFGFTFAVKFLPAVNWGFYFPANEKIKRYYPLPELGQLAVAARKVLKKEDKVLVVGDDWFSPKIICFNIAPVKCAIYHPEGWKRVGGVKHRGMEIISDMKSADNNVIIHYNFGGQMPHGFKKIYELNKNAYIARK